MSHIIQCSAAEAANFSWGEGGRGMKSSDVITIITLSIKYNNLNNEIIDRIVSKVNVSETNCKLSSKKYCPKNTE